jgi:hypothetical protein
VYPVSLGSRKVGFGVHVFLARATATSPPAAATTTTTDTTSTSTTDTSDPATVDAVETLPDVTVSTRVVLPEVSLNFGSSRGWSYVGVGAGPLKVRSEAAGVGALTTSRVTVSVGAGARWFISHHVGVGFDLRLMTLSTRTLFAASAGFSLK